MATVEDLQTVIQSSPEFAGLPIPDKLQFIQQTLRNVYGEQYSQLTEPEQRQFAGKVYTDYFPKSTTESIVTTLPVVGPLAEKYYYERTVEPTALGKSIGVPESAGAVERAVEDLGLAIGSGVAAAYLAPVALTAGALGIARYSFGAVATQRIKQEALAGGIFEIGKFVFQPPDTVGEAALRLGTNVGTGILFGGLAEPVRRFIGTRLTQGRLLRAFGEQSVVDDVISRLDSPTGIITNEEADAIFRATSGRLARNSLESQELHSLVEAKVRQRIFAESTPGPRYDPNNFSNDIPEDVRLAAQEREVLDHAREVTERDAAFERQAEIRNRRIEETQQAVDENISRRGAEQFRLAEEARLSAERTTERLTAERLASSLRESDLIAQEQLGIRELQAAQKAADEAGYQRLLGQPADVTVSSTLTRQEAGRIETNLREAQQRYQANIVARNEAANGIIAEIESGRVVTNRTSLTKSESMLVQALRNPEDLSNGFVLNDPVTLPLGVIQDTPQGPRPVIIESINGNQATLRQFGNASVNSLRHPAGDAEQTALTQLLNRNNVLPTPTNAESIAILRNRVNAEQARLLADSHALRPDFSSSEIAQTQEFQLRLQAVTNLLDASNRNFSETVATQLQSVKPLVGERIVGSIERVSLREANDVAMAFRGSGFENVRLSSRPDGTLDVTFARGGASEAAAVDLNARRVAHSGVYDPTDATYEGLSPDQHRALGEAFGFNEKQLDKFEDFLNATTEDLAARGIRVPVDERVLGIRPLSEQSANVRVKKPDVIDARVIGSIGQTSNYEVGDLITFSGKDYQVAASVPFGEAGERSIILQSLGQDDFGDLRDAVFESTLKSAGAVRSTSSVLGPDRTNPLPIHQPATTLEAALNPNARPVALPQVKQTAAGIRAGASEAGFSANVNANGDITINVKGVRTQFTGPNSLQDAAHFIENMRNIVEGRKSFIERFGGPDCIGG